jgi:hypothetical protein
MTIERRTSEQIAALHEKHLESITLLTREDVARLWSISIWTVWQRTRSGKMPKPVQFTKGGPHYWRLSDLKTCLDRMQRQPGARR